jgi:transcriptional regulator with PAS, ATPase and Fis domain
MKSLAILTNSPDKSLGAFLKENLESVFSGYLEIRNRYIFELEPGETLEEDLVLVMTTGKAMEIGGRVRDPKRIVVARRTIRESEAYKVCSIPADTSVLVVNDNPETTLETVALLYQLEIHHLNLLAFEKGKDYSDIGIAITPGEAQLVPPQIGTVIDLGHRCLDVSTIMRIAELADLGGPELSRRMLRYSEGVVSLDSGIKGRYRDLSIANAELDAVINLSRDGILLVDRRGIVSLHNRSLEVMLELEGRIDGRSAAECLPPELLAVMGRERLEGEVIEYRGRSLVVTRRDREQFGERAGSYYNVQEVTYLRQLEDNLTKKLRDKGLLARYRFPEILTRSSAMETCIDLGRELARSDLTVLVVGESGTGKELFAQSIHNASDRSKCPFVAFNCAAVAESLMESELFGYEGGSFTGALREGKAGLFEQADSGTIFLDEIGDMPYSLQSKLLRVLQERQVMRVGSQRVVNVDIRVIAATNTDLRRKMQEGQFREDLYYRLNVLPIRLPPLRERPEDVLFLFGHFLGQKRRPAPALDEEAQRALTEYSWPGNIRELMNVASYVSFMAKDMIGVQDLPYYVFEHGRDFEAELAALRLRMDEAAMRGVLETIGSSSSAECGTGRRALTAALVHRNLAVSEGTMRSILSVLSSRELTRSSVGRRGTHITAKGLAFLNWLKNRQ